MARRLKIGNKTPAKKLASARAYRARKSQDPDWIYQRKEYNRVYRERNIDLLKRKQRKYVKDVWEKFSVEYRLNRLGLDEGLAEHVRSHCGLCDICGREPNGRWKQLAIDHCHDTGKFRGMICSSCNVALGYFGHDIKRLRKAIKYLERAKK